MRALWLFAALAASSETKPATATTNPLRRSRGHYCCTVAPSTCFCSSRPKRNKVERFHVVVAGVAHQLAARWPPTDRETGSGSSKGSNTAPTIALMAANLVDDDVDLHASLVRLLDPAQMAMCCRLFFPWIACCTQGGFAAGRRPLRLR
jgi:hypothetical protein